MFNYIALTGNTQYPFQVDTGCTVVSEFDDIVSTGASITSGSGVLKYINSIADGSLKVSGNIKVVTGAALGSVLVSDADGDLTYTAVGAAGTYFAGSATVPTWATLNQAAVAGLTTASGPTFDHLHITNTVVCGGSSQASPVISARYAGNAFEFGHTNASGYGSTIGGTSNSGYPFIAFNAEWDALDTYKTRGAIGRVIWNDPGTSFLKIGCLTNGNAAGQTPTVNVVINSSGYMGINDPAPAEYLDVNGNINVTGVYKVDDVQVVSNRVIDARCDDAINSGDATTDGVIDALRDAMIAHGLIAAA
jgi:hypothetical protein